MKKHIVLPMIFVVFGTFAQSSPKESVQLFFKGMHQQDTVEMRNLTYGKVELKSISKSETGKVSMHSEDFGEFLKIIVSLPKNMTIEEKIHAYEVKIDGAMANVWTPYSFYVNGKLSHCGANSFQLIRINDFWKIFSITDTRRKDCGD